MMIVMVSAQFIGLSQTLLGLLLRNRCYIVSLFCTCFPFGTLHWTLTDLARLAIEE